MSDRLLDTREKARKAVDSPPAEGVRVSKGGSNDNLSSVLEVLDDVLVGFL